jgi:hypothetical protein
MMTSLETMPATFSQEEITQPAKHDSMEQLFVVHRSGSIVLFSHHFDEGIAADQQDDDIHGAAIDAMDKLLGEILSNDGHIRQIVYADKIIAVSSWYRNYSRTRHFPAWSDSPRPSSTSSRQSLKETSTSI